MIKSLKARTSPLADPQYQLEVLEEGAGRFPSFEEKLAQAGLFPLKPVGANIFQLNLGKMCNQVCKHCHVDAGPDRKEIMSPGTMQQCLEVLRRYPSLTTVDLTGGAPEMNPGFRDLVTEIHRLDRHIIVRCNLTIIMANKKYHDLPEFYRDHGVEVVSSLPFYTRDRTDRQRGEGVFADSIEALRLLNKTGYGREGTSLVLNLVYNPAGAFLPPGQDALEREYKEALRKEFDIEFNSLYTITNLPVSRYLDFLIASGNYNAYMEKLVNAFNPAAAANVMCRNTLSVGWDGFIYDCDFNQMLDLKVSCSNRDHVADFDLDILDQRDIIVNRHCYGCTAGAGSSCGGSIA